MTSLLRLRQGLRLNISEVEAKVQVGQDLASAYRLCPPLCAVPILRVKIKRRGYDKRLGNFRIYLGVEV
jgi:hypothetical protein